VIREEKGVATFICLRHSNVRGEEGPFRAPIHRFPEIVGEMSQWHIDCPICGRVYVLREKDWGFYSDRPLKLLRIDFE